MNCVRWSMGDASLHGMGTSSVPGQCFGCYPCPWTKLLPMSPDRTECHRGAVLEHASQIGIEVAVPQLRGAKRKRQVCKDLVIWPRPMMTCWNKDGAPVIHPLAVLQWKTGTAPVANDDFRWLSGYSRRNPGVAAYAVALN